MTTEDVKLSFKIEMETRKIEKRLAGFDREVRKSSKAVERMGASGKAMGVKMSAEMARARNATKKYAEAVEKSSKDIFEARSELASATTDEERKAIAERVKLYEKEKIGAITEARKAVKSVNKELQKKTTINFAPMAKTMGKESVSAIKEALSGIKGKDLMGIFKGGSGLAAALLKGSVGLGSAALKKGGGALAGKGGEMGGGKGKALAGIGKAMGMMGQAVGSLSKLAPILGLVGGALTSVVKLLIDVEAYGKDINKEILQSASSAEMFAKEGWNAQRSMMRLDKTLETVRDSTHDWQMNMEMGTQAKDHLAVLSVLNQQGISVQKITSQLEENSKSTNKARQSMTQFSDVTKMAIGFSRLFGVSVDEIATFQAEMMSDLGMNLLETKREFSRMTAAATDSGIAANKFFAILRNVSSDLSLYGVRIGEVTKMLKGLGKVMSPRTAQKFLQSFAAGMKGFSSDDAFKMVLLGGPGAVADISKDLAAQKKDILAGLAAEAGVSQADAEKLLKGGEVNGKTLTELGKEGKVSDVGTKREAFLNAQRGEKQLAAGGTYGAGMAAKNMSGYGSYALKKRAALRLGGSSSLEGAVGLHGEKAASVAGMDGEKFDELLGIERAIKQQQMDVARGVQKGDPEIIKKLTEMGVINANMTEEQKKAAAAAMSEKQVFESISDTAEKEKTIEEKMLDAATQQGTRTQDIMGKLQNILDAIMNYLYKIMVSIWDTLVDFSADFQDAFHIGDAGARQKKREETAMNKVAFATRDVNLLKAMEGGGGSQSVAGRMIEGEAGQNVSAALGKEGAEGDAFRATVGKKLISAGGVMDAAKMSGASEEQLKKLHDALYETRKVTTDMQHEGNSMVEHEVTSVREGASLESAAAAAGLNAGDILQKSMHAMKGKDAMGTMNTIMELQKDPAIAKAAGLDPAKAAAASGVPQGAAAPAIPATKGDEAVATTVEEQTKVMADGQAALEETMKKKVKLDKTFLKGDYEKTIESGVLDATRQALFEFAMYTSSDPAALLNQMLTSGFKEVGGMAGAFEPGEGNDAFWKGMQAPDHAEGGRVIGIANGRAMFAPPGEGLTSIGAGERILPAGGGRGGGGSVTVNVNGIGGADLGNYLKEKVGQLIYEYKRREKYT